MRRAARLALGIGLLLVPGVSLGLPGTPDAETILFDIAVDRTIDHERHSSDFVLPAIGAGSLLGAIAVYWLEIVPALLSANPRRRRPVGLPMNMLSDLHEYAALRRAAGDHTRAVTAVWSLLIAALACFGAWSALF